MQPLEDAVKSMSIEVLQVALADLKYSDTREEALNWFDTRLVTPFGYGWCLEQSGINPNTVRRIIKRFIHMRPRNRTRHYIAKEGKEDAKKIASSTTS